MNTTIKKIYTVKVLIIIFISAVFFSVIPAFADSTTKNQCLGFQTEIIEKAAEEINSRDRENIGAKASLPIMVIFDYTSLKPYKHLDSSHLNFIVPAFVSDKLMQNAVNTNIKQDSWYFAQN